MVKICLCGCGKPVSTKGNRSATTLQGAPKYATFACSLRHQRELRHKRYAQQGLLRRDRA